jgi:hypothetical protein
MMSKVSETVLEVEILLFPPNCTNLQHPEGPLLRHGGRGAGGRAGAGLDDTKLSSGLPSRGVLRFVMASTR